ncbi:MAG: GNAT family N-acetyltransferase [Saccharofermentans sp.]|nr:GNAT family N-acetyltransferase [Saccharofermentans sp.]
MRPCLITTERLVIRPVEVDDLDAIYRYAGDPSIDMMMFLPKTYEETKEFVEFAVSEWAKEQPEDMEFVILLNGEIIGAVNLEYENDGKYEIGWIIRENMRGKGYAAEAAKALMDYAFDVLNAEKIQAHCDSRNKASESLMKKLGMTLIDDTAIRYYPKRDVFSGEYLYAIAKR